MSAGKSPPWLARFQSLIALVVMVVALALLSDRFLTVDNGVNVLRAISVNLCLSIGMTLVILSGGIDLSVGAILGLAGAVAAGLVQRKDVTNLGEVLTGSAEGRGSAQETTLFDSTGLAIQDLGIVLAVWEAWREGRIEAPTAEL